MLSKTKGGGQGQRERGEGERGKETRALISQKKGDIHLMTEGKKERKKKTKQNTITTTKHPPLKNDQIKNANKQTLQMYLDPI